MKKQTKQLRESIHKMIVRLPPEQSYALSIIKSRDGVPYHQQILRGLQMYIESKQLPKKIDIAAVVDAKIAGRRSR